VSTKYWRDIQERTYPFDFDHASLINDFQRAAISRMQNYSYDPNGGFHCIATGLDWPATDVPTLMKYNFINTYAELKKEWQGAINNLNKRKLDWSLKVRECPSSRKFLKQKIYDKKLK